MWLTAVSGSSTTHSRLCWGDIYAGVLCFCSTVYLILSTVESGSRNESYGNINVSCSIGQRGISILSEVGKIGTHVLKASSFISCSNKRLTKATWGRKRLSWLTIPGYSPSFLGSQGRNSSSRSHHIHSQEQTEYMCTSLLHSPQLARSTP